MNPPDDRPRTRWPRRLALVLGSLVLTLALGEALATWYLGERFVRGAQLGNTWKIAGRRDPLLGWSGRPHAHGRIVDGRMDYTVQLDSRGLRDPERQLEKPEGTRRVLALGDSVAWGWGVQRGERFTDLLDERLGPDVEVINLACPGYGTDQQYWALVERGLAYEPDAVVLCVIINDVLESARGRSYDMAKPRFVRGPEGTWRVEGRPVPIEEPAAGAGLWRRAVRHSALLTLATRGPLASHSDAEHAPGRYRPPSRELLDRVQAAADALVDPQAPVHHALTRIRDACAEHDLPLLVTHVAHKHDQYLYEPRFPLPDELGPEPFRTYFTRRLAEACAELGVRFVPTDDAFLEAVRGGTRLHVGDGHPNAAGHRLMAERLEPVLREVFGED